MASLPSVLGKVNGEENINKNSYECKVESSNDAWSKVQCQAHRMLYIIVPLTEDQRRKKNGESGGTGESPGFGQIPFQFKSQDKSTLNPREI